MPDLAARYFYSELFSRSPETRALFREDMEAQRDALIRSLEMAVEGVGQPDTFYDHIEGLGRRHAGYGVQRQHYESAGAALIWMLEQSLGDGFTDETRATWEKFWGRIASTMIAAIDEAEHSARRDAAWLRNDIGSLSDSFGGASTNKNGD